MLFRILLAYFVRFLLSLRYRIDLKGLDQLKNAKGILFLPNHPCQLDPVILAAYLWPRFQLRPLVVEYFYEMKGVKILMKIIRALPVPDMDIMVNKWKLKRMEASEKELTEGLNKGENFLIYPSGRLKLTGEELVGGASMVHSLIERHPEAKVVLVRTTGLWGSSFSRALTGRVPSFGGKLVEGIKILLKNGLFFTPRRKVRIDFEEEPKDFPRGKARIEFNQYLERWYNQYPKKGAEPLKLVSYAFWKKQVPEVSVEKKKKKRKIRAVSSAVNSAISAKIAELAKISSEDITPEKHLSFDLGLDSLDVAQLYSFLDERYSVAGLLPGELQTVEDVLQAAVGNIDGAARPHERDRTIDRWPEESKRPIPTSPLGRTIPESFLLICKKMGTSAACLDRNSGLLRYKRLQIGSIALAKKLRDIQGDYVGVMLPSSVGAYLSILACLLAGKIPVMLNWTAGTRALDHALDVSEFSVVLTSMKFLDNLEDSNLGKIEEKFRFLEDLKKEISFADKLSALFLSKRSVNAQLKSLGLQDLSPERPAVLLFTSGTEALPKAVPLSHRNLLENQRGGLSVVDLHEGDILYGVLPPFHSFGFSVTGLMPLLSGIRVCYAPDPTDSAQMARDIEYWKPTLFCCAPSFIRALFHIASKEQLSSLRMIVSGAERTPDDLFMHFESIEGEHKMLEGYGITECGPIVTLTRPNCPRTGVGMPVPGVELCVLDEQDNKLPLGKEGEVCVFGPNVFGGYLKENKDPFVDIEGKHWYRTGDRGIIDASGCLTLVGRLKRFVKVGGEMVSLGGMEHELQEMAQSKQWAQSHEGPPLAVIAKETGEAKSEIYLFSTFPISKEDVNVALKERGHGRIVKISQIVQVPEIPLTGTGKTDYRRLEESIG